MKKNLKFYLFLSIIYALIFFSTAAIVRFSFSTESSFQNSIVINNNKKSVYQKSFASIRINDNKQNWTDLPIQKKLRELSANWPVDNENDVSFFYTSAASASTVKISNGTIENTVSAFGIPHIGATGSTYGFIFSEEGGEWNPDFGQADIYISESLSSLLSIKTGQNVFVNTLFGSSTVTVRGVVSKNPITYIQDALGEYFVIFPYASALNRIGYSGEAIFVSSLGNDFFQNITTLKVFETCQANESLLVEYQNNFFYEKNQSFNDLMLSFESKANHQKISPIPILIFLLMTIEIFMLVFFRRLSFKPKNEKRNILFYWLVLPALLNLLFFSILFSALSSRGIYLDVFGFPDPGVFVLSAIVQLISAALFALMLLSSDNEKKESALLQEKRSNEGTIHFGK